MNDETLAKRFSLLRIGMLSLALSSAAFAQSGASPRRYAIAATVSVSGGPAYQRVFHPELQVAVEDAIGGGHRLHFTEPGHPYSCDVEAPSGTGTVMLQPGQHCLQQLRESAFETDFRSTLIVGTVGLGTQSIAVNMVWGVEGTVRIGRSPGVSISGGSVAIEGSGGPR